MILSKKQLNLFNDIVSPNIPNISVLGSTQSGKTYDIVNALIQYARNLKEYEEEQRQTPNYINRDYYGAIIGWTADTLKSNIIEPLESIFRNTYHFAQTLMYILYH